MSKHRQLRVEEDHVERLLTQLDFLNEGVAVHRRGAKADCRRAERYSYRLRSMKVEMEQANGQTVTYAVPSRNISSTGVSFLVGNFVYPGTRCFVYLTTTYNSWQTVPGRVVRCRYVEGSGRVYEVGVHFDQAVDITRFAARAVRIRVLVVDDSEPIHRLVQRFLESATVQVTHLSSAEEAVKMAMANPFDLVLMDVEMPGKNGLDAVRELRAAGYVATIVAMTALNTPEFKEQCTAAGCSGHLAKPFTREALWDCVNSIQSAGLVSSIVEEHEMTELIQAFVAEIPERLQRVRAALQAKNLAELEREVRALRGEAGAYGFGPIADRAAEVEKLVGDKVAEEAIQTATLELVKLCMSARASS
ncbi:MAG: Sensor histidine kinase RcsC [Phycisphaerae bacterium]|nr:Sensor histidine kinase RcsC [Phycisphaerae bacterium]